MRLNKEEMVVGAAVGAAWVAFAGLWTLLLVPGVALLWALGGSVNKAYRRFGVAATAYAVVAATLQSGWFGAISAASVFGVLSLGYGIPTYLPPDAGSAIGRWAWKVTGQVERRAQSLTRTVLAGALALAYLPLVLVNVWGWVGGAVFLVIALPLIVEFVEGEINV